MVDESDSVVDVGRNSWRVDRAGRASLIIDAAGYFKVARDAMMEARSQILLIGWDLDTRIRLVKQNDGKAPIRLGPFLSWLARRNPQLHIHILPWVGEAFAFLGRGTTLVRLADWRFLHRNIHFKFDGTHPREACHHQKILVIDDRFACCGGIDMTGSRWDTSEHLDNEPGRRRPTTGRHYGPWHDATMALDGAAAKALGELGRDRWENAGAERPAEPEAQSDPWPAYLDPDFRNVDVAIARTRGRNDEIGEIREIEALFIDMIGRARHFVYAESQYFASRAVAEAIARRLEEDDPPEFLLINPESADGWLEEQVMGAARAELFHSVGKADRHGRFRIYYPVTRKGEPIYVHAKIMIVDDVMLRVGSANFNNRSMGLDSECDALIDCARASNASCRRRIRELRCRLMSEHLGTGAADVERLFEETGSLIETVERLRGEGRSLRPYTPPEFSDAARKIAKSEVADPEGAGEMFEPMTRRHLLRGLPKLKGRRAGRRKA